jgi:hypothetical protein
MSTERGLCECGCGQPTELSKTNRKREGWVKGEPLRFLPNHGRKGSASPRWKGGRKISSQGYVLIYAPVHPKADAGYVREHVLVAERSLGRYLPDGAVVHHANEDRTDNRPENLVICDRAYHMLIHQRMRANAACGNPNWWKCRVCGRYDAPENLRFLKNRNAAYHAKCQSRQSAAVKRRRRDRHRQQQET